MAWSVEFLNEDVREALDDFLSRYESQLSAHCGINSVSGSRACSRTRSEAEMTQEEVAEAMGTTQAVVARLESGKVLPSTRTLERFAKATRTRLRISFEPDREAAR
jgi:DNA-binding XRE family transcriptional regulator